MTNENETLNEADTFAALLPWYVSGKISAADKARVEAYLATHPEAEMQLELVRAEADAVFSANQEIATHRVSFDAIKAKLHASPSARFSSMRAGLIDRVGSLIASLTPRQLALAGMAAALAVVVQTATIGALVNAMLGGGGSYETASGPGDKLAAGTYALVSFQPAAPAGTLSAFLADAGYVIVEGPKAGGVYRLRLSGNVLTDTERDAIVEKLKTRTDLISFASAAPAAK